MDLPEREHCKSDKELKEYTMSESQKIELSRKNVDVRKEARM